MSPKELEIAFLVVLAILGILGGWIMRTTPDEGEREWERRNR
jgi:hypothetical protein